MSGTIQFWQHDRDLGIAWTETPGLDLIPGASLCNNNTKLRIVSDNWEWTKSRCHSRVETDGTLAVLTSSNSSGAVAIADKAKAVALATDPSAGVVVAPEFTEFASMRNNGEPPSAVVASMRGKGFDGTQISEFVSQFEQAEAHSMTTFKELNLCGSHPMVVRMPARLPVLALRALVRGPHHRGAQRCVEWTRTESGQTTVARVRLLLGAV